MLLTADQLRTRIRGCARDGQPLEQIERELIEPAPLGNDAKSGLWLYAWSGLKLGRGRRWTPSCAIVIGRG
jgi:hypothetical protein